MKLNRIEKALLSVKKQKVAKYKDEYRQGVGGTNLVGLGNELSVIVRADVGTEWESVIKESYVYIPLDVQSDGVELFKFLCRELFSEHTLHYCSEFSFEIVSLDGIGFKETNFGIYRDGFYTNILNDSLYNSITTYGYSNKLVKATSLFDLGVIDAYYVQQRKYLDYYGFDLNKLYFKLINNYKNLEEDTVAEVVNTIYDFKNKNNIADNLLKGFIYWFEDNLLASYCEEDLIQDTLANLEYLNYLSSNGFNAQGVYFFRCLVKNNYPLDIKQATLYINEYEAWVDKELELKGEEFALLNQQQENPQDYVPIYYPEYNWFDLAVNGSNYPKSFRNHTFYPSYSALEELKQNKIRNFKTSRDMLEYNPFVAIKALGLSQHFPAGMLCTYNTVLLIKKLAELVKTGDFNVAKGFVCKESNPTVIAMLLIMSHYLGKEVVNGDINYLKYVFNHSEVYTVGASGYKACTTETMKTIPEKYKAQIAKSRQLLTYIFESEGEVDWSLGNSAKKAVILTIAKNNGCSEQIAEQLLNFPSAAEAVRYQKLNPNLNVVDTLPNLTFEQSGLVFEKLAKQDIRNLYIGDLTGCCQKLGGFGEAVCREGWKDPHSANYVFRTGSTFLAHVWVFETQDGGLMLDSVEGLSQVSVTTVAKLIEEFVSLVNRPVYISYTGYGVTSQVKSLLTTSEITEEVAQLNNIKPICNYSYTDFKGKCDLIIA